MALVKQKIYLEEINEDLGDQLERAGIMKPSGELELNKNKTEEMQKRMQLQQKEKAIQERAERQKMLKKGVDLLD